MPGLIQPEPKLTKHFMAHALNVGSCYHYSAPWLDDSTRFVQEGDWVRDVFDDVLHRDRIKGVIRKFHARQISLAQIQSMLLFRALDAFRIQIHSVDRPATVPHLTQKQSVAATHVQQLARSE